MGNIQSWRYALLCLTVTVIASDLAAQGPERIVWGTVYNIFHEEYATDKDFFDQASKDIDSMRAANIDQILIFPMNQWDPQRRSLKWDRTDFLIRKIEHAGLHFVPLMLKEEQCSHYFPIWKFRETKGLWDLHAVRNHGKNNRENVDFNDPLVFPQLEAYFKEVIGRYGKSPALSFYNVWNEPHYSSEAAHVVDEFRSWLRKKYGSLERLRRVWGDDYAEWNEVTPFLNDNWNSSMPQIDWTLFRNELNGALLAKLTAMLRKYDTVHPVNANPVGSAWSDFGAFGSYTTDNWAFTGANDFNGLSYYPDGWERGNGLTPYPAWLHNYSFTAARSAAQGKKYILTEMFTNAQNGFSLNGYLTGESISTIAWTALSNDCKGILFWKWEPFRRGRQSLGRGLTTTSGTLAPRGEAVKAMGRVMARYGDTLCAARLNEAKAAVAMDMVGLLKSLEQQSEPATTKFMYESCAGIYKALYEKNITTDILRMDLSPDLARLRQYTIIFLPFQIVMRKETAALLKEYVKLGGTLVADARIASLDETDVAYRNNPGAGMDELFGAVRTDWIGKKGTFTVRMNAGGDDTAYTFEGRAFRDKLIPSPEAKVLGTFADDGSPAFVLHQYGKGKAIYSAVPLGASSYADPMNPVRTVIDRLVDRSGITPDAVFTSARGASLDLKVHSGDRFTVVYAINTDAVEKHGAIETRTQGFTPGRIVDIITGATPRFSVGAGSVKIDVAIPPMGIQVLLLTK